MRKLTAAGEQRRADELIDELLARGIEAQVRGDAEVWVLDHDKMAQAVEVLAAFTAHGPSAAAGQQAGKIRKQQAEAQVGRDHVFRDVRSTWGGPEAAGFTAVTVFLIVGSVLVSVYSDMGDAKTITIRNLLIEPDWSAPFLTSVRAGEVWRLVTPMFIHFGITHLVFNMFGVWRYARQIEAQQGPLVLIALVLWAQIPGAIGQYAWSGPYFGGMSGVLYGAFGYVWMQARYERRHQYVVDEASTWLMMIWFVLCATGLVGPIANVGHAAGLAAGLVAGLPAYVRFLRGRAANPEFREHSWADVHIRGKTRIYRQFVAPYVPLWFLVLAAAVIALER